MAPVMDRTATVTPAPSAFLGSPRNVKVWANKETQVSTAPVQMATTSTKNHQIATEKGPTPTPERTKNQKRRDARKAKKKLEQAARLAEAESRKA